MYPAAVPAKHRRPGNAQTLSAAGLPRAFGTLGRGSAARTRA